MPELRFVGGPLDGHVKEYPYRPEEYLVDARNEGMYHRHGPAYYWVTRHAEVPHPVVLGHRTHLTDLDLTGLARAQTRMLRHLAETAQQRGYILDLQTVVVEIDDQKGTTYIEVLAGEREREK